MAEFPPTIIVVHPKERRSKCTAEPLRDRDGFVFWTYPHVDSEALAVAWSPDHATRLTDGLHQKPGDLRSSQVRGQETLAQRGGYVRLGLGGPALSPVDADCGLLVLDGTWRYAGIMEQDFRQIPVRTLPPWKTAYPRTSKLFADPPDGLATIEAVYAAYTILRRDTTGLFDHYHWADAFLEQNRDRLSSYDRPLR